MKKAAIAIVLCAAALVASGFSRKPQQAPMTTYQLVILKRGPAYTKTVDTPEAQALLQQHVKFLYSRGADGTCKAAGPFTEDGEIAGIIIVAAATADKAREAEAEDPAVKAGVFTAEAISFMAPEGWFPGKWAPFGEFEHVFFGFLNNGPDRTQDQATAARLQQEHLAYMAGQAKEGKLVAAGPISTEGTRRGIVVYRVASMEEAKERASADPMVKAGRLAIELHPWQVPVGALPK
jgi:uncharacterized protein YciI